MTATPDASVAGFLGEEADALRYGEGDCQDIRESAGIMRLMMPQNVRVLDVGCGGGGYAVGMNVGKNNTVVCIEPDPERAASARAKGLTVYEGILDDNFISSNGKFDVIVFGDVLEHMVDPTSLLKVACGILTESGRVLISVPNVAHWTVRLKLMLGKFNYQSHGIMDATHLRWFTKRTLLDVLRNAGLEIVEFHHSAGLWIHEYNNKISRIIPLPIRTRVVCSLLSVFPTLMGVQHVLSAQPLRKANTHW